jgi:hypothetical protein
MKAGIPGLFGGFRKFPSPAALLAVLIHGLLPGLWLAPALATAEPVAVARVGEPQSAASSIVGKWRTSGTFSLYVNGNLTFGGDGPSWVTFKANGSMATEMDFFLRWAKSGNLLKLYVDKNKVRNGLGSTPGTIRYTRNSLAFSGKTVSGNVDCRFQAGSASVRLVWKFSGRR